MALGKSVETVLRLVEETTGLPVHVEPDDSLPSNILARLNMARGKVPFHRIAYQPNRSTSPDYLIVYQCGFVLRQYAVPVSERVDFARADLAERKVRQWVTENPKMPGMPEKARNDLTGFLFDGILAQLRSIPVGLRVDSWILDRCPDLAPLQREAALQQLSDNTAGLRPEVLEMMPDQALAASLSMGAAFAIYWAEKLNQPQISLPYRATGHLVAGQELFELCGSIPDDPAKDRHLIDAWADALGLQGWYRWIPSPMGK